MLGKASFPRHFGWAPVLITSNRMAGPISQDGTKVAWASRTNSPMSTRGERTTSIPPASPPDSRSPPIILPLSEQRFADSSPSPYPTQSSALGNNPQGHSPFGASDGVIPLSSDGQYNPFEMGGMYLPGVNNDADGLLTPNRETASAPAELHQIHRKITMDTPETKFSADAAPGHHDYPNQQLLGMKTHSARIQKHASQFQTTLSLQQAVEEQSQQGSHEFHLDKTAPIRALKHPPASSSTGAGGQLGNSLMGIIEEQRGQSDTPESLLEARKKGELLRAKDEDEHAPSPGQAEGAIDKPTEDPQTWGEPFKLQWIKTERLPFYRTRHLRNPWNHNREIKVSRDGIELEPSVGQALLEEWDRVVEVPPTEKVTQQAGQGGTAGGRHGRGRGRGGAGGGQRGKG